MWKLAEGFAKCIGAPENYPDLEHGSPKWYVYPEQALQGNEGDITYSNPETRMDVITRDDTGCWISSIVIVLEPAANAYPKAPFRYFVRFALRDRQCELHLDEAGSQRIDFNIDVLLIHDRVYETMLGMLRRILEMQPWSAERSSMSFALPPRTSDTTT